MSDKQQIVILGGGYAGLLTAVTLQRKVHEKRADITLVNKNDYHYLTTKIHESGAGTLDPEMVRFPISQLIDSDRINFAQDEVTGIDLARKQVSLKEGKLPYDYLVVSIGGSPQTFDIPGIEENAFFLFDFEGTEKLRVHIEKQFEEYRQDQDKSRLTFVIGGAGFTGMEFLYEILEHIPSLCRKYLVDESNVKVVCVEAANTLLNGYDPRMVNDVLASLQKVKCHFQMGLAVTSCTNNEVILSDGTSIKTNTMIWAGGVKGNPILRELGFESINGRVKINEFLEVPGHKDIYVLGDASVAFSPDEKPIPPSAQIALQEGQYCGYSIACKIYGQPRKPFQYIHRGTVMSMGRKNATGIVYGNHINGRVGAFMKYVIEMRYFYMLGGIPLLLKEWRRGLPHNKKQRIGERE